MYIIQGALALGAFSFALGDVSLQSVPLGNAVESFLNALGSVSPDLNASVNAAWYVISEI